MKKPYFLFPAAFLAATTAMAQPAPSVKLTPRIEAQVHATRTGGETYPAGAIEGDIVPGEETLLRIAGGFTDQDRDGTPYCSYQLGYWPSQPAPGPAFFWEIGTQVLNIEDEKVTLAYRWRRQSADMEESPAALGSGTVTLEHGQYRVLDRVDLEVPEGLSCFFESLMVTLSAEVSGPPELAARPVRHDVWLLRSVAGEPEKVLSQSLEGEQGDALGFNFEAWRREVPELRREDGETARLELRISGDVRSWWTSPEELLVVVHTRATLRKRFSAGHYEETSANAGRKRFVVRPGETVKIVIPPPSGPVRLQASDWTGPLPEGSRRDGSSLLLPVDEDLAAGEIALLVQASP